MGKEMTAERIEGLAGEASDRIDEYVKETGRLGVGVSYVALMSVVKTLSDTFKPEDITVAAEKVAETLGAFLKAVECETH